MATPDNPSRSEVWGQFPTLSARLDNLDGHVVDALGGGSYKVSFVMGYPAEDVGWDVEVDPAPWVGDWWPAPYYENTYVVLDSQDAYPTGVYRFTADPANEPLTFVAGYDDLPLGTVITSYQSDVYGKPGDYIVLQDGSNGSYAARWVGELGVLTVYTDDLNVDEPATDSFNQPISVSAGIPVPVLLTGQSSYWENGVYFATDTRLVKSRALDYNGYNGGTGRIATALLGDNGDWTGDGVQWVNDPRLGHPALWRTLYP